MIHNVIIGYTYMLSKKPGYFLTSIEASYCNVMADLGTGWFFAWLNTVIVPEALAQKHFHVGIVGAIVALALSWVVRVLHLQVSKSSTCETLS